MNTTNKKSCGGCLVLLLVLGAIGIPAFSRFMAKNTAQWQEERTIKSIEIQQLNVEKPLGTAERFKHEVLIAIPRSEIIGRRSGKWLVSFHAADNLSRSMIRSQVLSDVTDVIRATDLSQFWPHEITINVKGYFNDNFGNKHEDSILVLTIDSSRSKAINWQNFNSENIDNIALTADWHSVYK